MSLKNGDHYSEETIAKEDVKLTSPRMYKVILHNDDYTPMDFVIEILMTIFRKNFAEANQIMLRVHEKGSGVCGVYPFEIAETKVSQVHILAEQREYPLRASMEEV